MVGQHRLLEEALAEVEDVFTCQGRLVEQGLAMEILEVEQLPILITLLDLDQGQAVELVRQRQLVELVETEQPDVEKPLTLRDQLKILDVVVLDQEYQTA
jgi:hypothetical protein